MTPITLKAHFDGTQLQLDEPCKLPINSPLWITVTTPEVEDREGWPQLATDALSRAFSDHEPDYSEADLKL